MISSHLTEGVNRTDDATQLLSTVADS